MLRNRQSHSYPDSVPITTWSRWKVPAPGPQPAIRVRARSPRPYHHAKSNVLRLSPAVRNGRRLQARASRGCQLHFYGHCAPGNLMLSAIERCSTSSDDRRIKPRCGPKIRRQRRVLSNPPHAPAYSRANMSSNSPPLRRARARPAPSRPGAAVASARVWWRSRYVSFCSNDYWSWPLIRVVSRRSMARASSGAARRSHLILATRRRSDLEMALAQFVTAARVIVLDRLHGDIERVTAALYPR